MKRRLCLLVVLLLVPIQAFATDATLELLTAPHVRHQLLFQIDGKEIQVALDAGICPGCTIHFETLTDQEAFAIDRQIDLAFKDYNPLLLDIKAQDKKVEDVSVASLGKLLDALAALGKSQTTGPAPAAATADAAEEELTRPPSKLNDGCDTYRVLHQNLWMLRQILAAPGIDKADVQGWVEGAVGQPGVAEQLNNINTKIKDLGERIEEFEAGVKKIDEIAKKGGNGSTEENDAGETCPKIRASTFALVLDAAQKKAEKLPHLQNLKKQLVAFAAELKTFTLVQKWSGVTLRDYVFARPASERGKANEETVEFTPRSISVVDDVIVEKKGTTLKAIFRLRRATPIVPEVAIAGVATNLSYPKYGTEVVEGKTKVKSAGKDSDPIKLGLMGNFIFNLPGDPVVYPGVQIGVTQAKDYPGFFLGGVARFIAPRALALSVGAVFTRYKDLDTLKVGDVITGTADLEKDLKMRNAPVKYYFSIQYTF